MAALQYLDSQRAAHPELSEWYTSLADLYQRKLWHQLAQKLEQFVALAVCFLSFLLNYAFTLNVASAILLCLGQGVCLDLFGQFGID